MNPGTFHHWRHLGQRSRGQRKRALKAQPAGILIGRKIRERNFRYISLLPAEAGPERGIDQFLDHAGIRQRGHGRQSSLTGAVKMPEEMGVYFRSDDAGGWIGLVDHRCTSTLPAMAH